MKKVLLLIISTVIYLFFTQSLMAQVGDSEAQPALQNSNEAVFEAGPTMNSNRLRHHAVLLPDGRVALLGGIREGFNSLNTAEIFDPVEGTFTTLTMQYIHDSPALARMNDGRYLIAGGSRNLGIPSYDQTEIFDPADLSFTSTDTMVRFRASAGAAALNDGRVVIASAWWNHNNAHTYGELYDPVTGSFSEIGPFSISRSLAAVIPTNDGKALVVGGRRPTGNWENMPVEEFNPQTGAISTIHEYIIEQDEVWSFSNNQGITAYQKMNDDSYMWLAQNRGSSDTIYFKLITIDPETKSVEVFQTTPSLPDSESFMFLGQPVIDNENDRAYMIARVMDTESYAIAAFTVDLATGLLTESSNIHYTETYELRSAPPVLLNDGRIFVSGGSVSNNFDAVNNTLFITPPEPVATSAGREQEVPQKVKLHQNYPNPFNPVTQISFELTEIAHTQLDVFDVTGRNVAQLIDETKPAGRHTVQFDASHLSTGVYVYRLTTPTGILTRKMVLVK